LVAGCEGLVGLSLALQLLLVPLFAQSSHTFEQASNRFDVCGCCENKYGGGCQLLVSFNGLFEGDGLIENLNRISGNIFGAYERP